MPNKDIQNNRENKFPKHSAKQYWAIFFDAERAFLSSFTNNKDYELLDHVEDYTPEYKAYINDKGKKIHYAPRTIRCIYYIKPGDMYGSNGLKNTIDQLLSAYRDARLTAKIEDGMPVPDDIEKAKSEIAAPPRFPRIKENVSKIHIGKHSAFRSKKVTIDEDLVLIKRRSKEYTGKDDSDVEMIWMDIIDQFNQQGIKAYIDDDKLMVSSSCLIKAANGCDVQFRVATGTAYTAWLYYQNEEKPEKMPYGFILCDTRPEVKEVNSRPTHSKQIRHIANEIEFKHLPDNYSMWAKTPKV